MSTREEYQEEDRRRWLVQRMAIKRKTDPWLKRELRQEMAIMDEGVLMAGGNAGRKEMGRAELWFPTKREGEQDVDPVHESSS